MSRQFSFFIGIRPGDQVQVAHQKCLTLEELYADLQPESAGINPKFLWVLGECSCKYQGLRGVNKGCG